jgi:uncharacterized protein (DUF2132 family)
VLVELVAHYGWPALGEQVDIRCFQVDPSVASSLKFLRRTPWARQRVESLYMFMLRDAARRSRVATRQPRGADKAAAGGREP